MLSHITSKINENFNMLKHLTAELKKELNEGMFDKIMSKFTPKRTLPQKDDSEEFELPTPDLNLGNKSKNTSSGFQGAIPPEYDDYGLPGGEVSKPKIKSNKMSLARPNDVTKNQSVGGTAKDKTYPMGRSSIMNSSAIKNLDTDSTSLHPKAFLPQAGANKNVSASAFEKTAPFSLETDDDLPAVELPKKKGTDKIDRVSIGTKMGFPDNSGKTNIDLPRLSKKYVQK